MALAQVSLDDRYALERGRVLMTGIQALVRLPMLQRQRDRAAGLNTAGFISGYRGSPLGGLDQALWQARKFLRAERHRLPARASTRTSAPPRSGARSRSACSRAPSTMACSRSGTARARASTARSTCSSTATTPAPPKHGGVLVVAGDDHAAKSSTLPHQSDHVFAAAVIPVLNPSGVQDYLDLGIHGWAMSRYSGCWVALKAVTDTVESTAVVDVDPLRVEVVLPDGLRHAAGRPVDPLARSAAGAGSADAGAQGLRRAGLCPRQPAEPDRHRQPAGRGWAS